MQTYLCEEFSYKCSIKDIKYKKLLKAISNQDFKGLVPILIRMIIILKYI